MRKTNPQNRELPAGAMSVNETVQPNVYSYVDRVMTHSKHTIATLHAILETLNGPNAVEATKSEEPANLTDMVAFYMGRAWIVEVKRKRISLNNCIQLKKYLDHLMLVGYQVIPCMAGPEISPKALKYCQEHGYRWIEVGFNSKPMV